MSSKSFSERYNIEFEPLDYAPDNVIVEVLEEDEDVIDKPYFGIDYDSDRFDSDTFAIWCDI